jgi:hypothetical protein
VEKSRPQALATATTISNQAAVRVAAGMALSPGGCCGRETAER